MEEPIRTNTKSILKRSAIILTYLKYIIAALLILFMGLFIIPKAGSMIFVDVVGRISPTILYTLIIAGPWSIGSWAVVIVARLVAVWTFAAFIIWVVLDNRKFKAKGINTRPFLWGIGMIYPLILVTFPLYLIKRNISWPKKLEENSHVGAPENKKEEEILKGKRKWIWKGVKILFIFFIIYTLVVGLLLQFGGKNKKLANFLVNYSLSISCASGKSGCDEPRPLPKILQNKKIVFNKDTSIQFDPRYRPEIGLTDLDILGYLNTNHLDFARENTVDPSLGERGYLLEREYKIVRAVYHYNCSYCVDSSDYAYIVIEDSKGNRFSSLLDDLDRSTTPGRDVMWDEQVPYDIGRDGELGKLVDINAATTQ